MGCLKCVPAFIAGLVLCAAGAQPAAAQTPGAGTDPTLAPYAKRDPLARIGNGRTIHFVCLGSGSPTVILTAGLGDWSIAWRKVQPEVAKLTRVCAWDRAARGFSSASPVPQTVVNMTTDLEKGLFSAAPKGPYVLVGHAAGAYETLLFADRHPQDVMGMVLVDPSFPDEMALMHKALPAIADRFAGTLATATAAAKGCAADLRSGKLRLGAPDPNGCLKSPPDYPPALSAAFARLNSNPARHDTQASQIENFATNGKLIVNPKRAYGALPLIVLTGMRPPMLLPDPSQEPQREARAEPAFKKQAGDALAALSLRGVNREVKAGHDIQLERPDSVITAITDVVRQAQRASPQD